MGVKIRPVSTGKVIIRNILGQLKLALSEDCCCSCCRQIPETITGRIESIEGCAAFDVAEITFTRGDNPDHVYNTDCLLDTGGKWIWTGTTTLCGSSITIQFKCCGGIASNPIFPGSICDHYLVKLISNSGCITFPNQWYRPNNLNSDECAGCCGSYWEFGVDVTDCECCDEAPGWPLQSFRLYINEC